MPRRWSMASFAQAPGRQLGHGDHVVLISSSRADEDSAERSAAQVADRAQGGHTTKMKAQGESLTRFIDMNHGRNVRASPWWTHCNTNFSVHRGSRGLPALQSLHGYPMRSCAVARTVTVHDMDALLITKRKQC